MMNLRLIWTKIQYNLDPIFLDYEKEESTTIGFLVSLLALWLKLET